jgi:general secretion pathway protein I
MARAPERGFTLVEVLVALGIVAIALMAGLQATTALTRNAQRQTDIVLAQLCAENELVKARLSRQMPSGGRQHRALRAGGAPL